MDEGIYYLAAFFALWIMLGLIGAGLGLKDKKGKWRLRRHRTGGPPDERFTS